MLSFFKKNEFSRWRSKSTLECRASRQPLSPDNQNSQMLRRFSLWGSSGEMTIPFGAFL